MEGLDIVALVTTWGWKAVIVGFAAFFLIEVFKPLIRKMIKNESGRHVFYSIIDIVLVAAGCYAWMATQFTSWSINWADFGTMFAAAYAVLKVIYPIYSNLGIQAGLTSLFKAIFANRKILVGEVKSQEATSKSTEVTSTPAAEVKTETKKIIEL